MNLINNRTTGDVINEFLQIWWCWLTNFRQWIWKMLGIKNQKDLSQYEWRVGIFFLPRLGKNSLVEVAAQELHCSHLLQCSCCLCQDFLYSICQSMELLLQLCTILAEVLKQLVCFIHRVFALQRTELSFGHPQSSFYSGLTNNCSMQWFQGEQLGFYLNQVLAPMAFREIAFAKPFWK